MFGGCSKSDENELSYFYNNQFSLLKFQFILFVFRDYQYFLFLYEPLGLLLKN